MLCPALKVEAQVHSRNSPVLSLEYSLKSLYDSANEVAKKNEWLRQEIDRMSQEVTFITEEMRSLETNQTKGMVGQALGDEGLMKDIPWEEKRIQMMYEDFIELDEEEKYLKDRFEGKKNDQQEIEEAVYKLEKEVAQLANQRLQAEEALGRRGDAGEFDRLKDAYARAARHLKITRDKYQRLENQHGQPLKVFSKIKDRNIELKGRQAFLSKQIHLINERQISLGEEIDNIKATDKERLSLLQKDVGDLSRQREDLLRVLKRANVKLGKDFSIPDYDAQIGQVKGNIETIKEENRLLKEELISLESKMLEAPQ